MINLHDWSVADLLDFYNRLEEHTSVNPSPLFFLDYTEKEGGWHSCCNAEGNVLQFAEYEAKLLLFFAGREYCNKQITIHLNSVAGQFRGLIKEKVDQAIPGPSQKWYQHINSYREVWSEA